MALITLMTLMALMTLMTLMALMAFMTLMTFMTLMDTWILWSALVYIDTLKVIFLGLLGLFQITIERLKCSKAIIGTGWMGLDGMGWKGYILVYDF